MIWLVLVILSILSAGCYRAGGSADYDTLWRDIGCSLLTCLALWFLGYRNFIPLVIIFGLSWGALTTYFQFFFKGVDNMYAHGLGCGLALLPYWFFGMSLWLILTRTMVLALSFGLLNKYVNKYLPHYQDLIEELSRGALIIATLLLFLI